MCKDMSGCRKRKMKCDGHLIKFNKKEMVALNERKSVHFHRENRGQLLAYGLGNWCIALLSSSAASVLLICF